MAAALAACIDDPLPTDWKALQAGVCRLLKEVGLTADVDVPLRTPRGKVNVDVYAVDENSVDKIRYIIECKNWGKAVPQTVVHAFTRVMQETGANIGFIISKHGLQRGARKYTRATNVEGLTYAQLQARYFPAWWKRHFCRLVADRADIVNAYAEPYKAQRAPFVDELSAQDFARFQHLQNRYAAFGMLMWQMDLSSLAPGFDQGAGHPAQVPSSIDDFKKLLVKLLNVSVSPAAATGEEFKAVYFRPLLGELCVKLDAIETEFNSLFGRNIFAAKG